MVHVTVTFKIELPKNGPALPIVMERLAETFAARRYVVGHRYSADINGKPFAWTASQTFKTDEQRLLDAGCEPL